MPYHTSIIKNSLVPETPLILKDSICVEDGIDPLEGQKIDVYYFFKVIDKALVMEITKLMHIKHNLMVHNYITYFNKVKHPWPHTMDEHIFPLIFHILYAFKWHLRTKVG